METSYAEWSPADYLAQYYANRDVALDERGNLAFILKFLAENQNFSEMLEVGCGPTIHHTIPFAPYVDRILMADFVESNLGEIQKWVFGEGHDWNPYISGMLEIEGNNSESAIAGRTQMIKEKVKMFLPCDALSTFPLGIRKKFPLVTSFYCLECIGQNKEQWKKAMLNVSGLVAPDGHIILSALRNADKYLVCGKEFPATSINELDLGTQLIACGFNPATVKIEVMPSGWDEEGFDSILIASAKKGGT